MRGVEGGGSISIARGVSAPTIGITRAISPGAQILSLGWSPLHISSRENSGPFFRSEPTVQNHLFRSDFLNSVPKPEKDIFTAPKFVPARRSRSLSKPIFEQSGYILNSNFRPNIFEKIERVKNSKMLKVPRYRTRIDPGNIISLASSIVAAIDIIPKQRLNIDIDEEEKTRNQAKKSETISPIQILQPKQEAKPVVSKSQVDTQAALEVVRVRIQALSPASLKRAVTPPAEIRQVTAVLKSIQKEVTKQPVADKQGNKEKEVGSGGKIIRWRFVKDIKAMAERLKLITENTRQHEQEVGVNQEGKISAKAIVSLMPSESANKGVVSAILRNKDQPDGSYTETITAMENAGEFASGNEALIVLTRIANQNRAVKIANENDPEEAVGYEDVQKVLQRRIVKIDAHQVVQSRIQRKKMAQEQVWVEKEEMVKDSSVFDTQEIPEEAIDLSKETILLARQALKIAA